MEKSKPKQLYESYKKIRILGEGTYGKAYLVSCESDGSYCVIKQINMTSMPEAQKRETLQEAKILEALHHPNIVKFREVYTTKKGRLCIVMDYADDGELADKIANARKEKKYFSEEDVLTWFTQICMALKHVHDRKILHRDLKAQNIFLTKAGVVKLGDFGIAYPLNHTYENARTMVGTPYYLSPQIIENRPYSFKSDMWSLGVLLYEMCGLSPPFEAPNLHYLALKIIRNKAPAIPAQYSKELRTICSQLLQKDPEKRMNINQLLKKPILRKRIEIFITDSLYEKEFSHSILHNFNVLENLEKSGGVTPAITKQILKQQTTKAKTKKRASSKKKTQNSPIVEEQAINFYPNSSDKQAKKKERGTWKKQEESSGSGISKDSVEAQNIANIIAEKAKKEQKTRIQLKKEHDQERKKMREEMKKRKKEMEATQEIDTPNPITWMGQTQQQEQPTEEPQLVAAQSQPIEAQKSEVLVFSPDMKSKTKEKAQAGKVSKDKTRPSLSEFKKQMKLERKETGDPGVEIYVKEEDLHEVNKRRQLMEEQKQAGVETQSKPIDFQLTDEEGQEEEAEETKEEIKVEDNVESEEEEQLKDQDFEMTQSLSEDQIHQLEAQYNKLLTVVRQEMNEILQEEESKDRKPKPDENHKNFEEEGLPAKPNLGVFQNREERGGSTEYTDLSVFFHLESLRSLLENRLKDKLFKSVEIVKKGYKDEPEEEEYIQDVRIALTQFLGEETATQNYELIMQLISMEEEVAPKE